MMCLSKRQNTTASALKHDTDFVEKIHFAMVFFCKFIAYVEECNSYIEVINREASSKAAIFQISFFYSLQ